MSTVICIETNQQKIEKEPQEVNNTNAVLHRPGDQILAHPQEMFFHLTNGTMSLITFMSMPTSELREDVNLLIQDLLQLSGVRVHIIVYLLSHLQQNLLIFRPNATPHPRSLSFFSHNESGYLHDNFANTF